MLPTTDPQPFHELERVCVELVSSLSSVSYNQSYYPHLVSVALFSNCLEAGFAMVILSRGSTDGGHPILLRTLFESTARLMFIAGSPENNALALERIDCEEMLRQTGKSPIQGEATETTEIRNLVCDRLTDLKKENVKRITFKEILMQGKLARQYPIYQQLCGVVHSQITPLLHNLANYQDKVVSFKLLRPYSEERRKALEEAAIAFLQLAELNIHRALAKLQTPPAANK